MNSCVVLGSDDIEFDGEQNTDLTDNDFIPSISQSKEYISDVRHFTLCEDDNENLLSKYRYIRHGLCSVTPDYYSTVHQLKSEFHMSETQAQGAICTGCKWKHQQIQIHHQTNVIQEGLRHMWRH